MTILSRFFEPVHFTQYKKRGIKAKISLLKKELKNSKKELAFKKFSVWRHRQTIKAIRRVQELNIEEIKKKNTAEKELKNKEIERIIKLKNEEIKNLQEQSLISTIDQVIIILERKTNYILIGLIIWLVYFLANRLSNKNRKNIIKEKDEKIIKT